MSFLRRAPGMGFACCIACTGTSLPRDGRTPPNAVPRGRSHATAEATTLAGVQSPPTRFQFPPPTLLRIDPRSNGTFVLMGQLRPDRIGLAPHKDPRRFGTLVARRGRRGFTSPPAGAISRRGKRVLVRLVPRGGRPLLRSGCRLISCHGRFGVRGASEVPRT